MADSISAICLASVVIEETIAMPEAACGQTETAAAPRATPRRGWPAMLSAALVVGVLVAGGRLTFAEDATPVAPADSPAATAATADATQLGLPFSLSAVPEQWASPEGLGSALQVMLTLGVLSLAPAVLLMTTCFVRIIIVLGLLRQALGTQQLPPNQVMTSIALFMSLLIMSPVWKQVYDDAIAPYSAKQINVQQAWDAGVKPIRTFMSHQIERTGNSADVWLFYKYLPAQTAKPESYDDVPLQVLLPAFMLSELKTAFLIGFQIYLPFLVLDLVVASVSVSMGMMMLPPTLISLPFKLLLFVLVDGWHLVVGMLLQSFQPFS
jgi:flagellar biosynthetic protein FliP